MDHVHEVEMFIFSHQFGFSALPMGWWSNGEDGLTEESLKTMSRYRNFTTICCAAVFALGLAACGGGDDGISVADRDAAVAAEQAKTDALQMEINALRAQLGLDPEDDPAASIQDLQNEVTRLQGEIQAAADKDRMAQEEADRKATAAMAAKLYTGIGPPAPAQHAAYGTGADASKIMVTIADDTVSLSEDKKTMVAAHHGWEGMRFAKASSMADPNSYEAMVYSNVGKPMEGSALGVGDDGVLDQSELTAHADVVIPSITRTTGTETIGRPEPNPDGQTIFNFPGSYQGVSGTYSCTLPGITDTCTAMVASNGKGFALGGTGTWTFKPTDPEDKIMSTPDANYSSYGWWIRTDADGKVIVSAFHGFRGTDDGNGGVSNITALNGTAVYMGGAAGKYALSSSTGGTNDSGHFTADVMLSADFNTEMISGTVDNFMGADGEMRNWSVELMKSGISNDGDIGSSEMTKWTIDGTTAAASGEWSGNLREMGKDGVPEVATGTFYSHYGSDGKIVGAFGANVQ